MTLSPKVWGDALRRLQDEIPEFAFDAWIAPMAVKLVREPKDDSTKSGTATTESNHVILGCPTSFHRERTRLNYAEVIRDCWKSACAAFDSEGTATIELLTMKDFAIARGTRIDIRLPKGRKASIHASMRKVDPAAIATPVAHAQSAAGAQTSVGESRPAAGTRRIETSDPHSMSRVSRATLHAVSARKNHKQAPRSPKTKGKQGREALGSRGDAASGLHLGDRPEPGQPELPFTFDNFIVGPCNALAREAALALARRRQPSLNQLYLGGGSGLGKTHLARATAVEGRRHAELSRRSKDPLHGMQIPDAPHALAAASSRRDQRPRVVYTSAEQFTSEFVSAMRLGRPEQWERRYRGSIGLLVVEDIQFFSGRAKTQLELFHTVAHVLDAGGRVLLTGDCAPRELVGLDDRMRAQVGRGFVAELDMPDALIRRHILRAKAAAGGVRLPQECLELLVESTAGSVRDIEGMLIQVVTTSSLLGRTIDLDLIHEAIAIKSGSRAPAPRSSLSANEIVRIVASFFGKRPETLAGRSRRRDVLVPRQLAMYLAHRYTDASFVEIGRSLGRDHPSVRNAIDRIERLMLENAPLRYQVEALSERIDQILKDEAKPEKTESKLERRRPDAED